MPLTGGVGVLIVLLWLVWIYRREWSRAAASWVGPAPGSLRLSPREIRALKVTATVEGEGYFNIVDRKKDVILTGGELVYSTEVENALYDHPAVFEAAVIGVADDRLGESVVAFVVLRNDVSCGADELARHCRDQLAHYKCPRTVDFMDELPRADSGKIYRRRVRDLYWEGRGRGI